MWVNAYRSHIGQVLPGQMPFEGSILENITFGNPQINADTVSQVIRLVGLKDFVRRQPKGMNSMLFPGGQQIPHTISKRILIARAIVHQPKILILKDALEHFETSEATRIMEYLGHADRPWMLIVAGQSIGWKKICNKTVVLKNNLK